MEDLLIYSPQMEGDKHYKRFKNIQVIVQADPIRREYLLCLCLHNNRLNLYIFETKASLTLKKPL